MSKRYERGRYLTRKYQNELLRCKYCGGKPIIVIDLDIFKTSKNKKGYTYCVACPTTACDCCSGKTLKEAMKKWNEEQQKPWRGKAKRAVIFTE